MSKKTNVRRKSKTVINSNNRVSRGGVYFNTEKNQYIARFTLNGTRIIVGSFMSERKAKQALNVARSQWITE